MYGVYVWAKHSYSPSAAEKKEGTRRSALNYFTTLEAKLLTSIIVLQILCIREIFTHVYT